MRIALSLLTLAPGLSGGSETYVRELARALSRVGSHEYEVLVPATAPDAGDGLHTHVATDVPAGRGTLGRLRSIGRLAILPGPLRMSLETADVVHFPLTVPLPRVSAPKVVTLHDLQHRDLPTLFSAPTRVFRRFAYDRAAQRATQVVVISEWTRQRAVEVLGLDPLRVHVVALGVDHARFRPDPMVSREPFILYPARPWPHKNHRRLFEAFALVRRSRPELRLVLTGSGHHPAQLPDGVETRGGVSADELVALYRRASALVFPSLYEGFGLPPLEAMACGCPVASSTAGSLPEVCGAAAAMFDPTEPEAIAAGVEEALLRTDELVPRGLERAADFTWDATAAGHDAVYELAAAERRAT